MYSLASINALIDDQDDINPALHASSAVLIFAAYDHLSKIYNWRGAGAELTDAELDDIDALIGTLYADMLTVAGGSGMDVGTVFVWAGAAAATAMNCLDCDGATHLRTDFPELFAALHSSLIVDADHFKTPDLRGRAVLGVGQGSGLTNRAMGASGGTENHQLTSAEMPSHTHVQKTLTSTSGAISGTVNSVDTTAGNIANDQITGATGGDGAHNNMSPFLVMRYYIRALP